VAVPPLVQMRGIPEPVQERDSVAVKDLTWSKLHLAQASFEAARQPPVHLKNTSLQPVEVLPGAHVCWRISCCRHLLHGAAAPFGTCLDQQRSGSSFYGLCSLLVNRQCCQRRQGGMAMRCPVCSLHRIADLAMWPQLSPQLVG